LFRELKAAGYQWRKILRSWAIAPFIPAPFYRKYRQWRRGGKEPWADYSPIHPEFAVRSKVRERAADEHLPFDVPPARTTKLARISDFHSFCETADWFATLRASFDIDVRTPAFDRRLFEFCIGVPEDQYFRNGSDRWLIRRAMQGRLPESVLNKKKYGAQAADWFPRLTRERDQITNELKRFGKDAQIASILDIQKLGVIMSQWPEHQPADYSAEEARLLSIPLALGAAYFIENARKSSDNLKDLAIFNIDPMKTEGACCAK
jgi:asparagine synthase (glutamine-hydrolysing)